MCNYDKEPRTKIITRTTQQETNTTTIILTNQQTTKRTGDRFKAVLRRGVVGLRGESYASGIEA